MYLAGPCGAVPRDLGLELAVSPKEVQDDSRHAGGRRQPLSLGLRSAALKVQRRPDDSGFHGQLCRWPGAFNRLWGPTAVFE